MLLREVSLSLSYTLLIKRICVLYIKRYVLVLSFDTVLVYWLYLESRTSSRYSPVAPHLRAVGSGSSLGIPTSLFFSLFVALCVYSSQKLSFQWVHMVYTKALGKYINNKLFTLFRIEERESRLFSPPSLFLKFIIFLFQLF